eukprot:TRINITY_DN6726_c0_g1_i1.p1 TRINITY_DN6726_c0_g1~~TRINITY_DN6726_c0_g1_i1.p1  ORF type:complete len:263 (+),score=70.03 TRINITY_DN6726_c0_g1_i1:60-848(+)
MKAALYAALVVLASLHCCSGYWLPTSTDKFQYQLAALLKTDSQLIAGVTVYDVDGFDTPKATVDTLHATSLKAVCYINGGAWENWRSDKASFPAAAKGKNLDGWAGEKWLDIRNTALLGIMEKRVKMCADKGFDAVEFDNVDGYTNATGFPLTADQQLAYNRALAALAHKYNMAAGLKNDVDQLTDLVTDFDFAINEECNQYNECDKYSPFVDASKPVFNVEYAGTDANFLKKTCPKAAAAHVKSIKKPLTLYTKRLACPDA